MALRLQRLEVGPWPMNCYLLRCSSTGKVAIIDPGADADDILAAAGTASVCCILLTHAHTDHVGALHSVRQITGAAVGAHPDDSDAFDIKADFALEAGLRVNVGEGHLRVVHVPGHTPGSVCLLLEGEAVVGDAIFPGGPGHTVSPEALELSLSSLGRMVFTWPDDTVLHPGHGGSTTVGAERAAFESFRASPRPPDLCGDVSWH